MTSFSDVARADWAGLARAVLREDGFNATQKARGAFLQFDVKIRGPFDTQLAAIVRVYMADLADEDVDAAADLLASGDVGCMILVETAEKNSVTRSYEGVTVIGHATLKGLLDNSSFVKSDGGTPVLSLPEITASTVWGSAFDMAALPSLRWLPALARNKRPIELRYSGISADRLFERAFFRVMTDVFQMRGESWGEQDLFTARPDGWLGWKGGGAIYDCKAAASGYKMSTSDWRKFRDYSVDDVAKLRAAGEKITHVLVVSSSFPGGSGKRHSVYARARKLSELCGVDLAYVRAIDISTVGKGIESAGLGPDDRRAIRWGKALSELTPAQALLSAVPEVV